MSFSRAELRRSLEMDGPPSGEVTRGFWYVLR